MTLGNAAAARVRLIVWCKACSHQAEPDAAEMAERFGADTPVLEWLISVSRNMAEKLGTVSVMD
jgi:hypothetical protein